MVLLVEEDLVLEVHLDFAVCVTIMYKNFSRERERAGFTLQQLMCVLRCCN